MYSDNFLQFNLPKIEHTVSESTVTKEAVKFSIESLCVTWKLARCHGNLAKQFCTQLTCIK